jgi:hypothetical protein
MEANMLKTPIGFIDVLINGKSNDYKSMKLVNKEKNFSVDGRHKVIVDLPVNQDQDIVIECKLAEFAGDNAMGCIESGERLALISFYQDNIKLSIGVEDEISNVMCCYIDYGVKVILSKEVHLKQVIFGIAWVSMKDREKEDIYTWFAADPTLQYSRGNKLQ